MLKCAYQQNLFPSLKMSPVTNTNQLARKFRFISVVLRSSPEHLCLLRRLASANGPHLRTQPVPSRDSVSLAPSEGEKLGMCYLKVLHLQLPHCTILLCHPKFHSYKETYHQRKAKFKGHMNSLMTMARIFR